MAGHAPTPGSSASCLIVRKARFIKGRRPLSRTDDDAIAFNESDFPKFFSMGVGSSKDPRVGLRDRLILLLMHYGGLRKSEAMSLWISDVYEDPVAKVGKKNHLAFHWHHMTNSNQSLRTLIS